MGRVEEASGLGQQHKFLYPFAFTDGSIAIHHVAESLNFSTGGNLAHRRPIQNERVSGALLNRRKFGEVWQARRGGYEYGSDDRDHGNDKHKNQDSEAVRSRNDKFLFAFASTAHAANIRASPISAKEFPIGDLMPGMSDRTRPMSGSHRITQTVSAATYESSKPALPARYYAARRPLMSRISSFTGPARPHVRLSLAASNPPSTIKECSSSLLRFSCACSSC